MFPPVYQTLRANAAVVALVKSAAIHCAGKGYKIRVNAVLPGVVETDMIRGVIDRAPDPAAARAAFEGMAPMKRMAQLDEVSALVAFLASDEASYMTGSIITADGGITAHTGQPNVPQRRILRAQGA